MFRGIEEQRPKNKGNRGTQAILGNIENQDFFFGEQGNEAIFFEGNKGTGTPVGGPRRCISASFLSLHRSRLLVSIISSYLAFSFNAIQFVGSENSIALMWCSIGT